MLNEKVASLLNEQINKEFYSAYLYLEFSAYFEDEGLDGFANWYKVQAQEERDHAMLMFQYLQNNSHRPVLEGIARPTAAPNGRLRRRANCCKRQRHAPPAANIVQWVVPRQASSMA